ncbi:MAG TPA: YihY/virulence factor BrkB family protein [Acetobacteraceae bacterium]|nr:YihY/virulence factor BrkB family protein [Acetobacteraceae bacterium]
MSRVLTKSEKPERKPAPTWRRVMISAALAISTGQISLVAAGCAFYATLALFPAITMLISIYGLVFNPDTVAPQLAYLSQLMPPAAFQLISDRVNMLVAQSSSGLGVGLLISTAVTLWSAATGTKSILYALNISYQRTETRGLIRFQITALGMTLVAILGAVLGIAVLVLVPIMLKIVGLAGDARILVNLFGFAALIGFMILALSWLYRYGPARSADWIVRVIAPGACAATLIWLVGSWGFALYVGHFAAYSATYGPLATIVGLMMWFYLTAYAVLFGAEINAALEREAVRKSMG